MNIEASIQRPSNGNRGAIVLDERRKLAIRRGRSIRLGEREAVILRTLLNAEGRVVSSESLVRAAWGHVPADALRRVRNAMGRLRSKLGPPDLIETIVGEGYRLGQEEHRTPPPLA